MNTCQTNALLFVACLLTNATGTYLGALVTVQGSNTAVPPQA